MLVQLGINLLSIIVGMMVPDKNLAIVSANCGGKDCIDILLLFFKELNVFRSSRNIVLIEDVLNTLGASLVVKGMVPLIIELLILQGREKSWVTLDPTPEVLSWCAG